MNNATRYLTLVVALLLAQTGLLAASACAEDKLLNEVVGFNGGILYVGIQVPGMVIGAVRNGETAVFGFGETALGTGKTPDGNTIMRIGSVTKAFTGHVMATLVAQGTVKLTDRLQDRIGWGVTLPEKNGQPIRLIHLVTHTSGLPREVERAPSPDDDPFRTLTP